MTRVLFRFFILITIASVITFVIHISILNWIGLPLFNNKIIFSYLLNNFQTILIFFLLLKLRKKFLDSFGYLFLISSFFKFTLFFTTLYGHYQEDGELQKAEFFAFFVPYSVCLTLEIISLIKVLENED